MDTTKFVGIALIVLSVLGLIYGGFGYDRETTKAKLGSLELKVTEHENVNVPLIVSAGGLALGIFLVVGGRKR